MAQMQIQVGADIKQALSALKQFSNEIDKAGGVTVATAAKMSDALDRVLQSSKSLSNLKLSSVAFPSDLVSRVQAFGGGVRTLAPALTNVNTQISSLSGKMNTAKTSVNAANLALINTGRVLQDLPFGFLGIANNLNPLLEGFQRLKADAQSAGVSVKTALVQSLTGAGGLGLAVSAVTAAISFITIGFSSWTRGMGSAAKQANELSDEIKGIGDAADLARLNIQTLENDLAFLNEAFKLKIEIAGGTQQDVLEKQKSNIEETIDGIVAARDKLQLEQQKLTEQQFNFSVDSPERKAAEESLKKLKDEIAQSIKDESEQSRKITLIESQIALLNKKDAEDAAKKLTDERKRYLAALEINFFGKFFKVQVDKTDLQKQLEDMAETAREFARKNFDVIEGLGSILFANSDKEAVEAGKRFWENYQNGIIRFKPQKIEADINFVPKVDTSTDFKITPESQKLESSLLLPVVPNMSEKDLEKFAKMGKSIGDKLGNGFGDVFEKIFIDKVQGAFNSGLSGKALEDFAENVGVNLGIAQQGIGALGEAFSAFTAAVFNGQNAIQSFGEALKNSFLQLAQVLIRDIILAAVLSAISSAFGAPVSFVKSLGSLVFGGGIPGHAQGVVVPPGYPSDSYLMRATSGEAVLPANLTRFLLSAASSFEGGRVPDQGTLSRLKLQMAEPQVILLNSKLRGKDLSLQMSRTLRSQSRLA